MTRCHSKYFESDYSLFVYFILFLLCLKQFFKLFQSSNQYVDLNFRAINYSAELYLNGHKKVLPKGMFRRHSLDVTNILNPDAENMLAVLVHPPDHPGEIPPQGGQGGDHEVCIVLKITLSPIALLD